MAAIKIKAVGAGAQRKARVKLAGKRSACFFMLNVVQQIVNSFHKEAKWPQIWLKMVALCQTGLNQAHQLCLWGRAHESEFGQTEEWKRLGKIPQVTEELLPLLQTFLQRTSFRWFEGDFIASVLLMVPVKHETLLFTPNHIHMRCLWAVIHNIHRQPETTVWRQLCQACKSCQVLLGVTHRHIYTLILDLYGALHPPLDAAVKVFLISYRSSVFKELHARTHKHAMESFRDL